MVKSCRVMLDTTDSFSFFSHCFFALAWETYLSWWDTNEMKLLNDKILESGGTSAASVGAVGFESSASSSALTGLPESNNKGCLICAMLYDLCLKDWCIEI